MSYTRSTQFPVTIHVRSSRVIPILILAVAFLFFGASSIHARKEKAGGEKLKFTLVLMRHGVRSPTWTNARLDEYSESPWPKWDVAPGLLTPHGKQLITQFGSYYRELFSQQSLLSPTGCESAAHVFIYSDTDERTLETGRGIADGMLPGCKEEIHSLGEGVQDVLFHASGALGKPDAELAFAAVAGRIGNDPAALMPAYESQLTQLQHVLSTCTEQTCAPAKKQLLEVTPSLVRSSGDHLVEIKGPLSTGATFSENLQLEYLEGMPDSSVGWGQVNEASIRSLMAIHAASSDILQRTPYIAQVQASNLLVHMLQTMEQADQGKAVPGAVGAPDDKVVFLVGHDTNISNVAALLDAHWLVNGYQRDDAAPGGGLVFELWQQADQETEVRVYYSVQSPAQMRNAMPVTLSGPPGKAVIFLPGCRRAGENATCTLSRFQRLVGTVTAPSFVK